VRAGRFASVVLTTSPFGLGAYGASRLAALHPSRLAPDFAQPLVVATAWGAYGVSAFAWLAAAVAASALLAGWALFRIARRPLPVDRYAVMAGALLGLVGAAAWPFVFSSDVYAYAAYGDLAERGFDPSLPAPAGLVDAYQGAARWQWQGPVPVNVYGPAALAVGRAAVRSTRAAGVGATLAVLRGATCVAFLASLVLLDRALRFAPARRRSLVVAAYGLNPVVLWGVAEGHNDAFVALGLAAAAALAADGRLAGGGFVAGLLPALKLTGLPIACAYVFEAWRAGVLSIRLVVAIGLGTLLATVATLPPLIHTLASIRAHGHYEPALSAQGLLGLASALGLAIGAGAWGARRLGAGDPRGYAWVGIAALLALPNAYPWYALWLVPCALAAGGGPAAIALWCATIVSLVRYLPDAAGTLSLQASTLAALIAIAPLGIALVEFGPRAPQRTPS